jgi:hypothetical protein
VKHMRSLKPGMEARQSLTVWLEGQGLIGVGAQADLSDHFVAAYACCLAAWKWVKGKSPWLNEAAPPHHPYDFAC